MNIFKYFVSAFLVFFLSINYSTGQKLSPYYSVSGANGSMAELEAKVRKALTSESFKILGDYHPAGKSTQLVIAFTSSDLTSISVKYKDRGFLGSVLKAALRSTGNSIEVTFVNPEYIFNAYFQEGIEDNEKALLAISDKVKEAMKSVGTGITAFGGELETDDLQEYQYMWGMPEFTDPVKLAEYASFEEGVKTIQENLSNGLGSTVKVYEHMVAGSTVAVFGVGVQDAKKGENHFLSIIGEKHIAAMPYEIILQGNKATMLHGRFRFALFWPELTMGTFTKIMSTPGDVEDFLKAIAKK